MRTELPTEIKTIEDAKQFLSSLHSNGEAYHPDDNPEDCFSVDSEADAKWCKQVGKLMEQIYDLPGNIGKYPNLEFDPCEYLMELFGHTIE